VLTSPLVRAAQTAEIVLGACGVDHAEVLRELATGDLRALLTFARGFHGAGPLCLVGHEPTLGELVAQLLGRIDAPEFPKSAVFAIDLDDDGAGRLAWRLRPRDLTTHSTL
jgi:phosphohistidine phosphatase